MKKLLPFLFFITSEFLLYGQEKDTVYFKTIQQPVIKVDYRLDVGFAYAVRTKTGELYVYGGAGMDPKTKESITYPSLVKWSPKTKKWSKVPHKIIPFYWRGTPIRFTRRRESAMIYNPDRDTLVVFGGKNGNGMTGYPGWDLWEFSFKDSTWRFIGRLKYDAVRFPTVPKPSYGVALMWDPKRHRIVLYGGGNKGTGGSNQMFAYDYSKRDWENIGNGARDDVSRSTGALMVYDSRRDLYMIFGGDGDRFTYEYNPNTKRFKRIVAKNTRNSEVPMFVKYPVAYYDAKKERLILYGGFFYDGGGGRIYNYDLYEWDIHEEKWYHRRPVGHKTAAYEEIHYHYRNPANGNMWIWRLFSGPKAKLPYETILEYRLTNEPKLEYLGRGCGVPAMKLTGNDEYEYPFIGYPYTVKVVNRPAYQSGWMFIGLARNNKKLNGVNLPFDLGAVGFKGCSLYVNPLEVKPLETDTKDPTVGRCSLKIPRDRSLMGLELVEQALSLSTKHGMVFSDYVKATIGAK